MKKGILLMVITLAILAGCKKENPKEPGSWTFTDAGTSVIFTAISCTTIDTMNQSILFAETDLNNYGSANISSVSITFHPGFPIAPGVYSVGGDSLPSINNWAFIAGSFYSPSLSNSDSHYLPISFNNQTITITVSNGKISASGNDIKLLNENNSSDTGTLTFNIHQQ